MGSRKDKKGGGVIRGTLANIGRVIAALIMVGIITGCIIASVLTVYILRYINSDEEISLSDLNLRYSTILYTEETDPETGEPKVLQQLQTCLLYTSALVKPPPEKSVLKWRRV